ncbi:MAG: glycosyltransferase [Halanaerobiales bacterium]|nr:glycosyltransferase [Halanaerobiales bacterium]
MRVNIVTEGNWIKKFWSDKIIEYNKTEIEYSLSFTPTNEADINFYICYNTYLPFNKTKILDVGYVTHIHKNNTKEHNKDIGKDFNKFKELDGFIHQSKRSLDQFITLGFPVEQNFHLISPIEIHKFRSTIKLGIIQNGEVEGKGLYFLLQILDRFNFENFKFIFCGRGWEKVTNKMEEKGIRFEQINYTPEEYHNVKQSELYELIDYLFVPSLWEGGPVASLEAMASGKPIISSDVGLIPEFDIEYMFKAGDIDQLISCLSDIEQPIIKRREKVEDLTYENFNVQLLEIFKKL